MSFKVCNSGESISAKFDGALRSTYANSQDYIVDDIGDEFAITTSTTSLQVSVGTGIANICGRGIMAEASNTITLTANSTIYLCLRIDLTAVQGSEGQLYANTSSTIASDNLNNNTSGIHDLLLATITTDSNGVSASTDNRVIKSKSADISLGEPSCMYNIPRWLRFNPSNKKGLIIKAGTSIKLSDGAYKYYSSDTAVDLSSYVSTSGDEYYVYLADDGTITAYTSYQSDKGVKIGRFHTLCASVGTATMTAPAKPSSGLASGDSYLVKDYDSVEEADFYALYNKTISAVTVQTYYDVITCPHPLSGFVAGDILPESVFCLSWFPTSKYEDGQVYDKDTGSVIDIYLQSGKGDDTRSVYNATHTVSRQPWNHQVDMRMVGKRLLTDHEFESCALGSNEKTTIVGASDKTTVGGHSDTAGRRMISAIGCEECCGYLWQWLDELSPSGSSGWATNDGHASFGQGYGTPYVLQAGGAWSHSSACGSRSRHSNLSRSAVSASTGGRGSSRLRIGA